MTNANVEKKQKGKNTKNESHTEVNNTKNERVFTKTILTYGKDVTMCSKTQTAEVLLR